MADDMWKFKKREPKTSPEAKRAQEEAAYHLEQIRARDGHVRAQIRALREARERNHFAEALAHVMGGRR